MRELKVHKNYGKPRRVPVEQTGTSGTYILSAGFRHDDYTAVKQHCGLRGIGVSKFVRDAVLSALSKGGRK